MADPLVMVDHVFMDSTFILGGPGEIPMYPALGPWYQMVGYISGTPVVWKSRDPTTNLEYPGGPPYPSPYSCVGPIP